MESIIVRRTGDFSALLFKSGDNRELRDGAKVLAGKHSLSGKVRFACNPQSYDYKQGATHFAFLAMPISVFGLKKLKSSKHESNEVFRMWLEKSLSGFMPDNFRVAPDRQKTAMLLLAEDITKPHVETFAKYWLQAKDPISKLYCAVVLIYPPA